MKLWYLSCLAIHFISSNSEGLTQVDASDEEFPDKGKESSFKQDVEEGKHKHGKICYLEFFQF